MSKRFTVLAIGILMVSKTYRNPILAPLDMHTRINWFSDYFLWFLVAAWGFCVDNEARINLVIKSRHSIGCRLLDPYPETRGYFGDLANFGDFL